MFARNNEPNSVVVSNWAARTLCVSVCFSVNLRSCATCSRGSRLSEPGSRSLAVVLVRDFLLSPYAVYGSRLPSDSPHALAVAA